MVFLLAAAFLGGFVPQWLEARSLREQLEQTDLQLRLAGLFLTMDGVLARRGGAGIENGRLRRD